jgi:hypothetical protein
MVWCLVKHRDNFSFYLYLYMDFTFTFYWLYIPHLETESSGLSHFLRDGDFSLRISLLLEESSEYQLPSSRSYVPQ